MPLAMYLNPNNHALDGGRATSAMEKESVARLAAMFGWESHLGHLSGGGTMANFEALWVGRELRPGKAVAASSQAHYTHSRLSAVLGVPFVKVPADARGRMDVDALKDALASGEIGTVVVTLGTTAAGTVDPLPAILELRRYHDFRIHVERRLRRLFHAGIEPRARGPIGVRPDRRGRFDRHRPAQARAPAVWLRLRAVPRPGRRAILPARLAVHVLQLGRAAPGRDLAGMLARGAAAAALWATMKLLPPEPAGAFARGLESCREAALILHRALEADRRFAPLFPPELDIVTWAVRAETSGESSTRARRIFEAAAAHDLHLALATFPRPMVEPARPVSRWDVDEIVCLRLAMKPEHREWMPEILGRLDEAAAEAGVKG